MKIAKIETLHCDAGWRPWTFVRVETDDGLVGWGECSDARSTRAVAGSIQDFTPQLIGRDPRAIERLYLDVFRPRMNNLGGVLAHAIAGVELALWDLKAKAFGVPVYELFGGPVRDRVRMYWSHCATNRVRYGKELGTPPLRTWDDVVALGREVRDRGFTALKSNIVVPGDPATFYFPYRESGLQPADGYASDELIDIIEQQFVAFRQGAGPGVGLSLDLNYNFRPESVIRIARRLEKFEMNWLEYDVWNPEALRSVRSATTTPICSGESLVSLKQYRPYFEQHAMDVAMIDIPWNGFSNSRHIAAAAESYEINVAPHNYYSHLATNIAMHLCAVVPNIRICECDVDDVPWKETLVTVPPVFIDGNCLIPNGPGWGTEINEDVLRAHPWPAK